MKRMILALVAALGLAASAHGASEHRKTYTLVASFDFDGAAASATAIHSADQIVDSTAYTIDAQPDSPRLLVATLTDADSSVTCTLTVVGTKADGSAATATATLTGGSGAKTLTPVVYFKTVTSSTTGVCTGEGAGDLVALGTSGNPQPVYFLPYGSRPLDSQGNRRFRLDWADSRRLKVTASGTTLTAAVASTEPFNQVAVGDLLQFQVSGEWFERVVVTRTSADQVVVDTAIVLPTAGLPFQYRKQYFGPDTEDGVLPVGGFDAGTFTFLFAQLGNDAKVRVQCRIAGAGTAWVLEDNSAITAGTNVTKVVSVDFRLKGYDECRAGLEWATNDADGDAGAELEIITLQFSGTLAEGLR